MKGLCLFVSLMLASAGLAQNDFPELTTAYRGLEAKLRSLGWYHGPSGAENEVLTRSQKAEAVVQTMRALKSHLLEELEKGELRGQLKEADFLTKKLLPACNAWMLDYWDKIPPKTFSELGRVLGECESLVERLSGRYESIRLHFKNNPEFNALASVVAYSKAEGWLISPELNHITFMHGDPTRRLMAQVAIDLIPRLKTILPREIKALTASLAKGQANSTVDDLRRQQRLYANDFVSGTEFWINELAPEIKKLGEDPAKLLRGCQPWMRSLKDLSRAYDRAIERLGGTPRFRDVPYRHWAAHEIQELRDAGVLVGYQDGKFQG